MKYFPIMGFSSIPWEMLAPHARQAMANHDQTLERLAERGGLDPYEAICILEDRKIVRGEARQLGDDNIKNDLRSKVADWNATNSQTAHAAVAIYAGIVALGEWAAERARCVCHKCGHRMRTPNAWRLCGRCEEGIHQ